MTQKTTVVRPDTIIDIKVSGIFLGRLHELLSATIDQMGKVEYSKALDAFKAGTPVEKLPLNYRTLHTIMTLVYEVETEAISQKKTEEAELPSA